jgi:hypothetical protein
MIRQAGIFLGGILFIAMASNLAQASLELGIDRSGLGNWDTAYKTKALEHMLCTPNGFVTGWAGPRRTRSRNP